MPRRQLSLVSGEYYHVFNRGIDKRQTFVDANDYRRALASINFYQYKYQSYPLSRVFRFEQKRQKQVFDSMANSEKLIQIICYCLMPNHFHFLLRQVIDGGISRSLQQFQNSYTKYFNERLGSRTGNLFSGQFKAVRIESEEQLFHVSRYIHLNPYSSHITDSSDNLRGYPWSSLGIYLGEKRNVFVETEPILGSLKRPESYRQFVFDHADYQRRLKEIEHLAID